MVGSSLPPGFRFHPTDEELVGYYLTRRNEGLEIELEVIPVIDLYKFDPWELPEKSFLPNRDMQWFFFCSRDRKYPNGSRTNRATKSGYWKATGKDRKVACQSSSVTGCRKTLVFYLGRAPLGDRTNWIMHEYRLCDDLSQGSETFKGAFALCRVVKKNEQTQKKIESNGGLIAKRVENGSRNENLDSREVSNEPWNIESHNPSPTASPRPHEVSPMETGYSSIWVSPDQTLDSSKENFSQIEEAASEYFSEYNEFPSLRQHEYTEFSAGPSYSDLNWKMEDSGFVSPPNTGFENYMELYANEDTMIFDYYDHTSSFNYLNPF